MNIDRDVLRGLALVGLGVCAVVYAARMDRFAGFAAPAWQVAVLSAEGGLAITLGAVKLADRQIGARVKALLTAPTAAGHEELERREGGDDE